MVSDGVGGYHGRAELECVWVEYGSREGGKGGMGGLGWVRGDREWEIENGVGIEGEWSGEGRKDGHR
jgi:hypothetical protein